MANEVSMKDVVRAAFVLLALWSGVHAAASDEPLHVLIDRAMSGPSAPRCSDAEFLRRASLDLIGVPPTAEELSEFLADSSGDKRVKAVDRLLASVRHPRHLAEMLDVMLMERRGNAYISQDDWMAYLLKSVREQKPYNQLAREILSGDGSQANLRAASRFYLDRGSEPNSITRDVGRIFLGRDMQCAQCHDHPLIDGYLQVDYHGLFAFLAGGYEQKLKEGDKEVAYYSERSAADIEFESVFVKGTRHLTGPRLPGGLEIVEPVFLPGDEYTVAPTDTARPLPKFSRRQMLADALTNGTNASFNENIANRLWRHMLGTGLVEPVDLHHPANPPTNPALLTLLGERFAAMNFNMQDFLREIALSQTYQRSIDLPADLIAVSEQAAVRIAELEAEVANAEQQSAEANSAFTTALTAWGTAEQAVLPVVTELNAARTAYSEALKKFNEAQKGLADAQAAVQKKESLGASLADVVARSQEAAALVGENAEMKAAAQKFSDRLAAIQAEIPALKEAMQAKEAALAEPTTALANARTVVEAAQAKLVPLKQTSLEKQQATVDARRQMDRSQLVVNDAQNRLAAEQVVASLKPEAESAAAALASRVAVQTQWNEMQESVTSFMPEMNERQARLEQAALAMQADQQAVASEQAELAKRTQVSASLEAAVTTMRETLPLIAGDEPIVEAVDRIGSRLAVARASAQEQATKVQAATTAAQASQQKMSEALALAQAAEQELAARTAQAQAVKQKMDEVSEVVAKENSEMEQVEQSIADHWTRASRTPPLKPLTPEQMCWSIFQVTGVYRNYWAKHENELNTATPLSEEAKADPAQVAARNAEIELRVYNELKGNVGTFVSLYGHGAGQPQTDFFASADQALFASNGGSILSWVGPSGDNPSGRVVNAPTPEAAAQALYVGVLSRLPDAAETAAVAKYLESRPNDKPAAAAELVWGLVTSVEFRFNH